jgi:alpha-tubulin suppressor-like RCC1 family protein
LGVTGVSPPTASYSPAVVIPSLDGAKALRISAFYPETACAIKADDSVVCWGSNERGVLGHVKGDDAGASSDRPCAFTVPCNPTPSRVGDESFKADDVVVGRSFACALRTGKVSCWGANGFGALGVAKDVNEHPTPALVALGSNVNVTKLSARAQHVCAITEDGKLFCWGANSAGELANGFAGVPECEWFVRRCNATPSRATELDRITDVSAGDSFTLAISNGTLYAWGTNVDGRLGHARNTGNDQVGGCVGPPEKAPCNGTPQIVTLP